MKIYNGFARGIRGAVRMTALRDWDAVREETAAYGHEPVVYVVHHQNLFGPVCAMSLLPEEVHLWALHVFCERKACFGQYYGYTFSRRFGWPRPVSFAAAAGLSLVIPPFLRSLSAIPVYRGMKEIRETMELTLKALGAGESILICPDRDYASESAEVGELYKGFLRLEIFYKRRYGKHLSFVPVHCSREEKRVFMGRPVHFSGRISFAEEQKSVAEELTRAINRMGR